MNLLWYLPANVSLVGIVGLVGLVNLCNFFQRGGGDVSRAKVPAKQFYQRNNRGYYYVSLITLPAKDPCDAGLEVC